MCVETVFLREGGFFFKGASFLSFRAITGVFWYNFLVYQPTLPSKTLIKWSRWTELNRRPIHYE